MTSPTAGQPRTRKNTDRRIHEKREYLHKAEKKKKRYMQSPPSHRRDRHAAVPLPLRRILDAPSKVGDVAARRSQPAPPARARQGNPAPFARAGAGAAVFVPTARGGARGGGGGGGGRLLELGEALGAGFVADRDAEGAVAEFLAWQSRGKQNSDGGDSNGDNNNGGTVNNRGGNANYTTNTRRGASSTGRRFRLAGCI